MSLRKRNMSCVLYGTFASLGGLVAEFGRLDVEPFEIISVEAEN